MRQSLLRWVTLCGLAELVGMTAAAAAARTGSAVLVVGGGLVEGLAVGLAQAVALRSLLPRLDFRRYVVVTLLVAGLGWGLGAVPSSAQDSPSATSPPLLLIGLAGAALGSVMGALMGTAQGWALRGATVRPWSWVRANVVAWTPVIAVMMVGASIPSSGWTTAEVLPWAALVGAVAGALLGLLLARFAVELAHDPATATPVPDQGWVPGR